MTNVSFYEIEGLRSGSGLYILDEIIKTNSLPDSEKGEGIEKISQLFDKFKIRFRFAYEIGLMTDKKFGIAQKEMEEIGKMIGGWSRWTASRPTG